MQIMNALAGEEPGRTATAEKAATEHLVLPPGESKGLVTPGDLNDLCQYPLPAAPSCPCFVVGD